MPNCISSPWIAVIIKRSRSSITRNLTSNCTRMSVEIKSFVFLDSETTGLPLWEKNRTKITELCFTVVSSDHLKLGVFPRVQNKLTFCFNPRKYIDSEASKITGKLRLIYSLISVFFKCLKTTLQDCVTSC